MDFSTDFLVNQTPGDLCHILAFDIIAVILSLWYKCISQMLPVCVLNLVKMIAEYILYKLSLMSGVMMRCGPFNNMF